MYGVVWKSYPCKFCFLYSYYFVGKRMAASAESLGSSQLSSGIQCSSTDNVVRGYKEEFSPPLKAELLCLLCNLGLRDPVKDGHGHVFCRTCFSDSVR